ncbi:MAG: energy-coupled thiamine transporter ThiT [Eubacteriales bacterium]
MKNEKVKILVEGAVMVALATVLSYIRIVKFPWGGSITLLSMLPIIVFSIRHGIKSGFGAAFVYSVIQLLQGIGDGLFGWGLTPVSLIACIFLDYVAAFTVIGIAGIFRKKKLPGFIAGTVIAVVARFAVHFLSGVLLWHSYGELWNGFSTENTYLYSLLYNGAYMLPELIFTIVGTVILFSVPQTRRLLTDSDKSNA